MDTSLFYESRLELLTGIPLSPDNNNQLYFSSRDSQNLFFSAHMGKYWTDFKYIRETRSLKVPVYEGELYNASYMRFKNENTGNIWFYAFILRTVYVNKNTTLIEFQIDAWQTYFSFLDIKQCDIEREHVNTEKWRDYTLPESMGINDYEIIFDSPVHAVKYTGGALVVSTIDLIRSGGTTNNPLIYSAIGGTYGGLPSCCSLYYVDSVENFAIQMSLFPWVAQGVIGIYGISKEQVGDISQQQSAMGFSIGMVTSSLTINRSAWGIQLESYLPSVKNKKLWTYPYTYIEICSPDGNKYILKPELVKEGLLTVDKLTTLIPYPVTYLFTPNYMNSPDDDWYNTGLSFTGYPSYPCLNNMYITAKEQAWSMQTLIQNQNIKALDVGLWGTAGGAAGQLLFGDVFGSLDTLISGTARYGGGIFNEKQRAERARLQQNQITTAPSISGGGSPGACAPLFARDNVDCRCRIYTVKKETRDSIDQFFTSYGYKVNRIGNVNINSTGRRYRYIQCNHVNMYGNIPQTELEQIKSIFLNGVTFWYDYENVGVY